MDANQVLTANRTLIDANGGQVHHAFPGLTQAAQEAKHPRVGALVLLLLATLVGVTGCGLFHKKAPPVTYDDPQIKAKVESVLKSEPLLKDSQIAVQSRNGVVELSGEIDSIAAKERAGLAAASVPGIVQVKNDLLVRTQARGTTSK